MLSMSSEDESFSQGRRTHNTTAPARPPPRGGAPQDEWDEDGEDDEPATWKPGYKTEVTKFALSSQIRVSWFAFVSLVI